MKDKTSIVIAIVLLSLVAVSLTIGFSRMLKGDINFDMFNINSKMEKIDSIEKDLTDVNKISLDILSTDVEIKEGDVLLVEYYSNQETNASIEYSNKTISINEDSSNSRCIGICNVRRKIIITLPNEYNGELVIEAKSGDIKSLMDLENAEIHTMSGDIEIKNVKEADIKTMSGDVEVEVANNITVNTMSGDVDVEGATNKLSIKTTSGDISVYNLDIKKSSNITSTSGDIVVHNNNTNSYVDTKTSSGDVRVKKSDRKSDIVLTIETTSGDIRVN